MTELLYKPVLSVRYTREPRLNSSSYQNVLLSTR